jgi:hypothetical protein
VSQQTIDGKGHIMVNCRDGFDADMQHYINSSISLDKSGYRLCIKK